MTSLIKKFILCFQRYNVIIYVGVTMTRMMVGSSSLHLGRVGLGERPAEDERSAWKCVIFVIRAYWT